MAGATRPHPWRVGLQNPLRPDSLLAQLRLDFAAVTPSGDCEPSIEADCKRYHHILDPTTGRPADTGVVRVTVRSGDPVAADGCTRVVFVLGAQRGPDFLERRDDLRALVVRRSPRGTLQLQWSEGLERPACGRGGRFRPGRVRRAS